MESVKIERLKTVLAGIVSAQAISKTDVLSIEEFVGVPVITTTHNLNKFTAVATEVCLVDSVRLVENFINENDITNTITYSDLVKEIIDSEYNVGNLLKLLNNIKNIKQETLDRLINEKYIFTYNNEKNETTNEVSDITNWDIYYALANRSSYLANVVETTNNPNNVLENIMSDLEQYEAKRTTIGYDEVVILPMLSALINNEISNMYWGNGLTNITVTVKTMHKLCTEINTVIQSVTELYSTIAEDVVGIKDANKWSIYNDRKTLNKMHHKYKGFNTFVTHPVSLLVLKIFSRLGDK